jgi:hypothetical protein
MTYDAVPSAKLNICHIVESCPKAEWTYRQATHKITEGREW